jgi:hypothetical protein
MNKHILTAVFFAWAYSSCSTPKASIQRSEKPKDAIQIAIEDFTTKCRLYKEDSVFDVKLWNLAGNDRFKDFVIVSIMGLRRKIVLEPEDTIGGKGKSETRLYERDGKIFIWRDESFPLTQKALDVFQRHNLIETDSIKIKYLEYPRDDSQKGAVYFFCKGNLAIYKRVVTNKGVGYFTPPVLKCSGIAKE